MPFRVLIAPDKFKGTLSAFEAADAIARGWSKVRPKDHIELLPMSDGGDGFGEVLGRLSGAQVRSVTTVDAAHRFLKSRWWWLPKTRTAIIESAQTIGLALLPRGKFHPFELDTFGLAKVFAAAMKAGARECIVGIGGSATNDGGFGLARGLGFHLHDKKGVAIEKWTELYRLSEILPPSERSEFPAITIAVDVENPLLGPLGCSRVYGPQKGLKPRDLPKAERNLERLATVAAAWRGFDLQKVPGTGAAGGLGFGLATFLGGRMKSGFEIFAERAALDAKIAKADLIITGEGSIDDQTLMGKGVGRLVEHCRAKGKPCLGLAGVVQDPAAAAGFFAEVDWLTRVTTETNAREKPGQWLKTIAAAQAQSWGTKRNTVAPRSRSV